MSVIGRRSIRSFARKPASRTLVEEVITSAIRAPSSVDTHPWNFTISTGEPLA
ncbi:nitroreductase family protein [Novosphingobium sp. HII-3]|uniref:nitroreductase family protein n=1 Tax=Novosphingobium sp. HII-3 TaxID=2075565 RepID=UPI000CDAFF64|nr:nitroreductase family protein [Novosphingobium sp. HII-3]